jgi:hypothetical protein
MGHTCATAEPWTPPVFTREADRTPPDPERREGVQPCTDIQLDAIADDYAAYMRARGFVIGRPEEVAIRRAAMIQDAWRVAFARVLE